MTIKQCLTGLCTISILANIFLVFKITEPSADILQAEDLPYLSKRIFAENQNDILINFIPLRRALNQYVRTLPDHTTIYFEYLPSGNSIGVNEKDEIEIASLVKIPTVMAVYYLLERGELHKRDLLTIEKKHLDPSFGTLWKKGVGARLTIEEAIKYALTESDNTAANLLFSLVSNDSLQIIFDSLDVPIVIEDQRIKISAKNYTSILRSLYLSSFLTKESSNEILDILTRTTFKDQIQAGVPSTVKIAHKIGIYESSNTYSDCGIVYVPQRPYSLCIMAHAPEEKAKHYMRTISKMIYEYVSAVKGGAPPPPQPRPYVPGQ